MIYVPRDFQAASVESSLGLWRQYQCLLGLMATGLGKTATAGFLANHFKDQGRILWLTHEDQLLKQSQRTLENITGLPSQVEKADQWADARIFGPGLLFASIQTMNAGRQGGRMTRFDPEQFSLAVVDEGHHSVAPSWMKVINYFRQNDELKMLLLTATPDRGDEAALGQIAQETAFEYDIGYGLENGWLVPISQLPAYVHGLDLSEVRTTAGELNGSDLARVLEQDEVLYGMATPVLEACGDEKTLIFTQRVEQARRFAEILNASKPHSAEYVCGTTPFDFRTKLYQRYAAGDFQYLINVGVTVEGFDEPGVRWIVMGRPHRSRAAYAQKLGRGTRPLKGIVEGLATPEERIAAIRNSAKPCIAEGQLVLTDHGLIPIEKVTTKEKVWDGVEFVGHSGVLFRGERDVISYAGLTATPEHEVWIHDETSQSTPLEMRQTFGECAAQQIALRVTGIGRQEIRETNRCFRRGLPQERRPEYSVSFDRVRVREKGTQKSYQFDARDGRVQGVWATCAGPCLAGAPMQRSEAAMRQSPKTILSSLWGARDTVLVQQPCGYGNLDYPEPWTRTGQDHRPDRQRWALCARQHSLGYAITAVQQYEQDGCGARMSRLLVGSSGSTLLPESCQAAFAGGAYLGTDSGPTFREERGPWPNGTIQRKARVFDILDAGPRHRFTVSGILVSNCMTVMDFCGNAGKHSLAHTGDVLGGRYPDEVVELAQRNMERDGKPADVATELQKAEREIARRNAEAQAAALREHIKVRSIYSFGKSIDPFEALDIVPRREPPWHKGRLATDGQRAALEKFGVNAPDDLSFVHAGQALDALIKRAKEGKPSLKQAKRLKQFGFPEDLNYKQAHRVMDLLSQNNWRPFSPHRKEEIVRELKAI